MIHYKEYYSGILIPQNIEKLRETVPIKLILPDKIEYSIPYKFGTEYGDLFGNWTYHREDGPAIIITNSISTDLDMFMYYGNSARNKDIFFNKEWRRLIEIKTFL